MAVVRRAARDWRESHRFFGGPSGLLRSLTGTATVALGLRSRAGTETGVDCVTFSILPALTTWWAAVFLSSTESLGTHVLLGDCSGGLRRVPGPGADRRLTVLPITNEHHGVKLDRFLAKVCRSPYVVVSDDDIFWLDGEPLRWALERLTSDERAAVVSLAPRDRVSSVMRRRVEQPMGSYCLVIDRRLWLREGLSFQIVTDDETRREGWIFDTADYAHVELLRRGYRAIIAPESIRRSLVGFEGISAWGLRIRVSGGDLRRHVGDDQFRRQKAYRVVSMLTELRRLGPPARFPRAAPDVVDPEALATARGVCHELLDGETLAAIDDETRRAVARLRPFAASDDPVR